MGARGDESAGDGSSGGLRRWRPPRLSPRHPDGSLSLRGTREQRESQLPARCATTKSVHWNARTRARLCRHRGPICSIATFQAPIQAGPTGPHWTPRACGISPPIFNLSTPPQALLRPGAVARTPSPAGGHLISGCPHLSCPSPSNKTNLAVADPRPPAWRIDAARNSLAFSQGHTLRRRRLLAGPAELLLANWCVGRHDISDKLAAACMTRCFTPPAPPPIAARAAAPREHCARRQRVT